MRAVARVDEDLVEQTLRDLIAIDSRNPDLVPGAPGEAEIARFLGERLKGLGLEVHLQEVKPGRLNVVGILPGYRRGAPRLMWNGHLDTVGTEGMTDPFQPRREGDYIYGRGAYDMKAGLAAAVGAVAALAKAGGAPGDVLLAGVCDEEYASLGTSALVREFRAEAALVLEPSGLGICTCHKGFVWAEVTSRGRAAHGSNYRDGVDAIVRMGRFLTVLDEFGRRELSRRPHPLLGCPSVHASLIEGGRELSTYPDRCVLQLERRTLPGETEATVGAELRDLVARVRHQETALGRETGADEWDVKMLLSRPPYEVDVAEPVVRGLVEAYRRVMGKEPVYTGSYPWTDAVLLGQAGMPTLIFGPGGDGAHACVERVSLGETVLAARILVELARNWAA